MNAWTPFLHPMYIGLLLLANSAYFLEVEQCILFDLHKRPNQTLSAKLVEIFWWALFHTTCYLCSFSFWNKHHKELAFLKSYSTSTDTKTLWIRLKKKGLFCQHKQWLGLWDNQKSSSIQAKTAKEERKGELIKPMHR